MPGARDGQLQINRGADSPPWTLLVWDDALGAYRDLHGADGAPGADGADGAAGLTWRGAWVSTTAYAVHDAVSDAGSAYVCTTAHTGHEPPNVTYWDLLASKGDTGATGATGAAGAAGMMSVIDDRLLSGNAASVDFTSIPGTYKGLLLYIDGRSDASATFESIQVQFNSDTSGNYDVETEGFFGTSSSIANTIAATSLVLGNVAAATAPSGVSDGGRIDIFNYAGTSFHKRALFMGSSKTAHTSGNVFQNMAAGFWRSTAAITSIHIAPAAGNFIADSRFTLYGY